MQPNPRVVFAQRPLPYEMPVVGKHIVLDTSRNIDVEKVLLNGGFITKTLILRYYYTHVLYMYLNVCKVLSQLCVSVCAIPQSPATLPHIQWAARKFPQNLEILTLLEPTFAEFWDSPSLLPFVPRKMGSRLVTTCME